LRVRPGASDEKKRAVVEEWYRAQLKQAVPALIAKPAGADAQPPLHGFDGSVHAELAALPR